MQNDVRRGKSVPPHMPAHAPLETSPGQPAKKSASLLKKRWWIPVVVVFAVAGLGLLTYGYIDTKNQLAKLSGSKTANQPEVDQLVGEIGKHFDLPDEAPTLATVSDVTKLKNQEFFKDAKDGDKVLIYAKEGRALLYRPSTGKIIEYSKVNLNTQTP
jgi:hypothetical protein